jgi:iron complex outermembrane receptor protein
VYQLVKDELSLFGNYMSGFQNLGPQSPNPDGTILTPDPIYATQSEGGIKAELLGKKLNFSASYYAIVIDNTVRKGDDGFYVQDGKQVSKGVEFEVNASPVAGLTIIAGYAYNDNRIVKATDKTTQGNLVASVPYNVGNVWISYRFQAPALKNIGVGIGGNYVDKAYMGTDNKYYIPSYNAVNATLYYDQPTWRLGFKANNIGGRESWDLSGAAQALQNYAGSLTIKF